MYRKIWCSYKDNFGNHDKVVPQSQTTAQAPAFISAPRYNAGSGALAAEPIRSTSMTMHCAGALLIALCLLHPLHAQDSSATLSHDNQQFDTAGLSEDDLESKVRSTLLFGGSSPVSFSGEGRLKLQYHQFLNHSQYQRQDRAWLQSNWEGNESLLRLGMVVRAGRNAVLWSKIGFQHTMPGNYTNALSGDTMVPSRHDKADIGANIHEDLSAGIALRTVPASFWLKMGNVQWTQASPLTIWKSQPRTFAWDYLPFEIEQPVARYYEYNIAKGEKSGRAAWNKKAFNGITIESINLPWNLYTNFLYGTFERYDNMEREYIDFSNDLGYAELPGFLKGSGLGDSYRHVLHMRLAREKALGDLTLGLNAVSLRYKSDIVNSAVYKPVFGYNNAGDSSFYKQPSIFSVDIKGQVSENFLLHTDIAYCLLDSVWNLLDSSGATAATHRSATALPPALYTRLNSQAGLPFQVDMAYIPERFYSPFSFAAPVDAFYPFGSNLVGPGKFIGRAESSPYTQNMAGINITALPKLRGYGHVKVAYGQHFQLSPGKDIIFFPYRLNGQDLFSLYHSSYNRWGNNLIDVSIPQKYSKRLGDESRRRGKAWDNAGTGGLRSDYLSMYEGFVPFESAADADSNARELLDVFSTSRFVPDNRKFSSNLEFDAAYDIGPALGYRGDFFISGYAALNSVTKSLSPVEFHQKSDKTILWGTYIRLEPAISIGKKFYLLGLLGYENWRAGTSYMGSVSSPARLVPIDYRDYAAGIGFDWDMLARAGLHGRAKYMKHDDINFTANNWETPVVSVEIKMWF